MITGLRRRHRTIVTVVFVIVVFLYVWAIMARKATLRVRQPPGARPAAVHGTETVIP